MKVKVIKDAFYDLEYIKAGKIIEFKGEKLPSWATLADGIETNKKNEKVNKVKNDDSQKEIDNVGQNKQEVKPETNNDDKQNEKQSDNVGQLSEAEKAIYLETLISEGIEKGILIEDADKKSVDEQIIELESALKI